MIDTATVVGFLPAGSAVVHCVSDIMPNFHAVEAGGVQACASAAVETEKSYCVPAPSALVAITETVKAVFAVAGAVHVTCDELAPLI